MTYGSGNLKLFLGIGIPLGVVFVLVIAYLGVRNRKLSQELQIEVRAGTNSCRYFPKLLFIASWLMPLIYLRVLTTKRCCVFENFHL